MFSASFFHLHLSPLGGLRARIHSSSSVPNFLKFLATVQEHDSPEPKNRYTHTHTVKNLTTVRVPSVDIIAVPHFMNDFNCWTMCYNLLNVNQDLLYIYITMSVCACHCFSDVAALSTPSAAYGLEESPLRSHRHSWRQQIFLRVATPQKNTESSGKCEHTLWSDVVI